MSRLILMLTMSLVATQVANAGIIQWTSAMGGNDHYYEYIGDSLSWHDAKAAAASKTHLGLQGYLATITSDAENTFVADVVAQGALVWVGGSDEAVEGVWRWVTGPEAGDLFSFTNWNLGEPNNVGNEDYLHINFGPPKGWNDIFPTFNTGYVVEYSSMNAVPEPSSMMVFGFGAFVFGASFRRRSR